MSVDKLLTIVPKYNGKGRAIEWIYKLEAGIEVLEMDNNSVIPFIILFFVEDAYLWYSSVMNFVIFEDYEEFRIKFIEFFTPSEDYVLSSLIKLHFVDITFKEYILKLADKFGKLRHLIEDIPKIQWFIRGLSRNWQVYFLSKGFTDYQELCYFAISLDEREDNFLPPLLKDEVQEDKRHSSFESNPNIKNNLIGNIERMNLKDSIKHNNSFNSKKNNYNKSLSMMIPTDFSSPITETEDMDESFNSINLKKVPNNPKSLSLVCHIEGFRVVALFYPLSFKASISIRCIERLKSKGFNIDTSSLTTNNYDESVGDINILGEVDLVLTFEHSINCKASFLVMKNQSSDILLGDRFMKTHFIQMDFALRRIKFQAIPTRPVVYLPAQIKEGLFF